MKTRQQQYLLAGISLISLALLYFFGRIKPDHSEPVSSPKQAAEQVFDFNDYLSKAKKQLPESQQAKLVSIENSVTRGDVNQQQLQAYRQMADFWKDSAKLFIPYAFYTGEASKLEKSEKSLTFAARNFFDDMRSEGSPELRKWKAEQAKELFEKALEINPANDSNRVTLGACYIFGNLSDNPMEGIMTIRSVAEKNPDNLYAQLMLGIGGVISGQYNKAVERLSKVVDKEPNNVEAMYYLGEAYELTGDKASAVKWYGKVKQAVKGSAFEKEISDKLNSLQ